MLRFLLGGLCVVLLVTAVIVSRGSDEPQPDGVATVDPNLMASLLPKPAATTRSDMVIPTFAPQPATRNPQGLPPVKVETAVAQPAHLRIQAIGLDLPIQDGALTLGRELAAPSTTLGVTWWKDGSRPGMVGNAVFTGHLDWGGQAGAFFRLRELVPGDIIQVYTADSQMFLYTVESTDLYQADKAPVTDILGSKDTPLLTLITCEGVFDYAKHDYNERRVVRAIWY
jgi:LPXTG-site transpeptidase (sortase) family protein